MINWGMVSAVGRSGNPGFHVAYLKERNGLK